jgi:hypothetical protein
MLYNFCFKVVLERNLHLKMLDLCAPAPIGPKPGRSNRYLFSIMMLESKLSNLSKNSLKYFPVGVIFGSIFLIVLFYEISLFFESNYNLNYFYLNIYQN